MSETEPKVTKPPFDFGTLLVDCSALDVFSESEIVELLVYHGEEYASDFANANMYPPGHRVCSRCCNPKDRAVDIVTDFDSRQTTVTEAPPPSEWDLYCRENGYPYAWGFPEPEAW